MHERLLERDLTKEVIGAAIEVHRYWGPGLLESIYEKSMAIELEQRNISFSRQHKLNLKYKGLELQENFRIDLIVGGRLIVELKVVSELVPIHEAQLLSYMQLTQCKVGLLINFNVPILKNGLKRLVL